MSSYRQLFIPVIAALLVAGATPAYAQSRDLVVESIVELERTTTDGQGVAKVSYGEPKVVVPGDRLRMTLRYSNKGVEPATNVRLRNPIQDGLQYDGTADLAGFSVSIDKGQTWGQLAELTITAGDGTVRAATMTDVTDVMWALQEPVAPGVQSSVAFFTRVR